MVVLGLLKKQKKKKSKTLFASGSGSGNVVTPGNVGL